MLIFATTIVVVVIIIEYFLDNAAKHSYGLLFFYQILNKQWTKWRIVCESWKIIISSVESHMIAQHTKVNADAQYNNDTTHTYTTMNLKTWKENEWKMVKTNSNKSNNVKITKKNNISNKLKYNNK